MQTNIFLTVCQFGMHHFQGDGTRFGGTIVLIMDGQVQPTRKRPEFFLD